METRTKILAEGVYSDKYHIRFNADGQVYQVEQKWVDHANVGVELVIGIVGKLFPSITIGVVNRYDRKIIDEVITAQEREEVIKFLIDYNYSIH